MYYLISILLIIAAIGLAIYGRRKYNVSLALAYVIPNLAFLYYIDDALNGSSYIKYGYYAVLIFGLLIFLFAKIFTYIYAYFTLLFLIVLIWASFYSMFNFNTENLSSIESWTIILLAVVILVLVRKSIKGLVIGMGSGFMLGIGVAALGFKSILNMGWGYIMDAIYLPGLTILLFTFAGISYQYYVNKSAEENPDLPKKQVNLYFGSGSAIIAVLLILLPLLLTTTPEKSAKKLAKAYCKCANKVLDSDNLLDIEEICKDKIGFSDSVKSISSIDDVQVFSSVFAVEISSCMNDIATNLERKVNKPKETKKETQSNQRNTIKETEKQTQSDQLYGNNENYDKFLGRYIGDFGMDRVIIAIENIDTQNGLATGYLKTLGEYENSHKINGPFKVFSDNELRVAMSDDNLTYDFYVNGKIIEGDAKSQIGETQYSFSLSKMDKSRTSKIEEITYYTIQDEDGYSNLRNRPSGEILMRVYESEIFEVIGSEAKHKEVRLRDGTTGYIHESRVVKSVNYRVQLNEGVTNVNVRSNYGTDNTRVINQISYPMWLTVIKEHYLNNEKWIFIKEKNGWILSSFVKNNNDNSRSQSSIYDNPNNRMNQNTNFNDSFYIINTKAVENENTARKEAENLKSIGYSAGYLWIPDYRSLSGAELYSVYIGPFYSQFECEKAVEEYRKIDSKAYALLVSQENKRVEIRGRGKVKVIEPNQNNQAILLQTTKYKIKIDNLGNNNYTYTAWPASSSMNDTPNIIVKNGKRYEDGRGGNHYYTFTNGNYKYECWINVLGTDETPPANLLVYNNDDLILSQDARIL